MTTAIERPIIFTGENVRKILDGTKTQTRRIIRPDHSWVRYYEGNRKEAFEAFHRDSSRPWNPWRGGRGPIPDGEPTHQWQSGDEPLPQNYQKGMHLWVREAWCNGITEDGYDAVCYKATGDFCCEGRWRSPLHMPRGLSRITLEITDVRAQRVQEITCFDIRDEGFSCPEHDFPGGRCVSECSALRGLFRETWNSINGHRASFEMNPWVFAITFRKVDRHA